TMGKHVPHIAVWRITDSSGRVVFQADPQLTQAVSPGVAWTTVQILQKVVKEGTGTEANFGRPAAGKTGTAEHWTNAWFVGFIPQLVAAAWVGFPQVQIPMTYPRLRLAPGPQRVAVPSVSGIAKARAQRTLQSFGFRVSVTQQQSAKVPPGTVLSQSPPAGSVELQGSTISITVATAPPAPSPSPSPVV